MGKSYPPCIERSERLMKSCPGRFSMWKSSWNQSGFGIVTNPRQKSIRIRYIVREDPKGLDARTWSIEKEGNRKKERNKQKELDVFVPRVSLEEFEVATNQTGYMESPWRMKQKEKKEEEEEMEEEEREEDSILYGKRRYISKQGGRRRAAGC
ncbi:hypothetical protein M0802_000839 [Mischocyttarus mexicanus]|nr:hypothetical protein M0802_000839 [Mischocyttarus mexicanus]